MKWISINDNLPDNYTDVLIAAHESGNENEPYFLCIAQLYKGVWIDSCEFRDIYTPTHWMPLPLPPKEKDKK